MLGKFFKSKEKEDQKEDQMKGQVFMKEIIEEIVKAVVDNPNDVEIKEIDGGKTKIIELKVAKDDIGKVIGKKGRTISAIRTLLASASGKEKVRYVLELLE